MRILLLSFAVAVAALIAGCGSGGSGNSIDGGHGLGPIPAPAASTAAVTVSTQSSSGVVAIYGAEFILRLPSGVSVPADAGTGLVAAGVITAMDSRATVWGRYLPATATSQASLKVNVADPLGFTVGDLVTINCAVSSGTTVSAAGFGLEEFSAKDQNGATISGITPRFTVQTQ